MMAQSHDSNMAHSQNCVNRNYMAHSLMNDRNPQVQDKYIVRMPDGMRDELKALAAKSGRSLNAEIVYRLANSMKNPSLEDAGFTLSGAYHDGLEFHEDLNWLVVTAAGRNRRSVREEIEERLRQSFQPQGEIVDELARRYFVAMDRLDEARKLIDQLSPAEKLILHERAEDAAMWSKSREHLKALKDHIELRKIGGSGRKLLTLTKAKPVSE